MATRKAAKRKPARKRPAKKTRSARAARKTSKPPARKRAGRGSTSRATRAAKRAMKRSAKGARKRSAKVATAVQRKAKRGLEIAREGLETVKGVGGKTWGSVKSVTAGVVQGVKQRIAGVSEDDAGPLEQEPDS
jgi:hypothetical protein